ncbi:hypothetical protein ACRAWG_11945 [Methylobacterium sp. P31]
MKTANGYVAMSAAADEAKTRLVVGAARLTAISLFARFPETATT